MRRFMADHGAVDHRPGTTLVLHHQFWNFVEKNHSLLLQGFWLACHNTMFIRHTGLIISHFHYLYSITWILFSFTLDEHWSSSFGYYNAVVKYSQYMARIACMNFTDVYPHGAINELMRMPNFKYTN